MPTARRALIAGLGLVGGSVGIALRRAGWHVSYFDPYVDQEEAIRAVAADVRVANCGADVDIVILATPVDRAVDLVTSIPAGGQTVTSVCSVMRPLREAADARGLRFVAGHPMAGSEQRGLGAASGDLLRDAPWFVDRDDAMVEEVIAACGANSDHVSANDHDAAVALTSHLPQLLSTALAAILDGQAARHGDDFLLFAGPGLRTFLRLAGSDASVWKPVIEANHVHIAANAERLQQVLQEMIDGDPTASFSRANDLWSRLK